ncbi:hypothetical protein Pint_18981 [Pistacia integerrima]|uniref:Uncharacterized protein n=1 Tax=Pistacia integerrima TaxID=434235 RepID=A0ACC0YTB4_9ROSI|nr:hypothetical protein Pint_18981 [Pistacia integerrima]
MENTWRKYLHAKIHPILALFCLSTFVHHLVLAVPDQSRYPYQPTENIIIACGSSDDFISQDKQPILGDNSSQHSPLFELQNNASIASTAPQQPRSSSEKYFLKARLSYSPFTYIFNLTAGQKFIRLYFYPSLYPDFGSSKAFFSVKANSFTLLSNFSASITAAAIGQDAFFKEFCLNVEEGERLNITFTPSPYYQQGYAFVNGIEIVSMPTNLYYTGTDSMKLKFLGQPSNPVTSIENSSALETVYRINVGGRLLSPELDTGMYRTWFNNYLEYLTDARTGAIIKNTSVDVNFSGIPNYTAPVEVYKTAMSMGDSEEVNVNYWLTWEFPVDSGFTYFIRLHFCEFQREITEHAHRMFEIEIANQTAETEADILEWSGKGSPTYRDYAVIIGLKENVKKQNLSVALHPAEGWKTNYSDAILNGLEIFKEDNKKNLAGLNPDDPITPSAVPQKNSRSTSPKNSRKTIVAIVAGVASGFILFSLIFFFIFRRARKVKGSGSSTWASLWGPFSFSATKSTKSGGSSLPSDLCTHFSLSDIKAATNNFDDVFIIGVGGFGSVYKGYVNDGSTPVAIKRLNPGSQQGANEFNTEIEMLSHLRHLHLGKIAPECLNKFAEVAMSCLDDKGTERPSMSEVVWGLEFALQLQETAEKNEKFCAEDENGKNEIPLMKYESDVDSGDLFSNIGVHVLDSKTTSSSDDRSLSTKSSDGRHVSGAVFSEIMNPRGR